MEERRARLWVIEDDEKLGRLVRRMLGDEHDVVLFTRAQEALDRITAGESFDLVLCDLKLPGVSGQLFHERVGVLAPERVARIVFITGGPCTEGDGAFLERPDITHIRKPFDSLDSLRADVREHLRRAGGSDASDGTR